jgi:DNA-binding Lrp family transcriptional regulator
LTERISKLITKQEQELLSILRSNARASISDLARVLKLSRSTIQNRINKLEESGIISGYVVQYGNKYKNNLVSSHVSIKVKQKLTARTNVELRQISEVSELYAISGEYDLIAIVQAQSLEQLSQILDSIGNLDGVERTNSAVVLETKFKR